MNNRKIIIFILLCIVRSLCFSQTKKDIMGFTLGENKKDVIQKLINENYIFETNDLSKEIFPITIEIYQKQNLTFNKIPVEHISFSFCHDKLFCISIVTLPIDNLELLTESRRILKQKYNFDKKKYIEINKELYDTQANPAFYSCNDNQDFILIIYGKENYRGNIPQCYNFMYKSEADDAIGLKNAFQSYSNIPSYTELTLEELREKQKFLEQKKLQEEKVKRITREKQIEAYNKKHRFDKYMGGFTAGYLGGGFYNGNNSGGFGVFDFSYNIFGSFSLGVDWRIGSIKPTSNNKEYGGLRMDLDAYLALGFAIPITKFNPPIIYIAAAPGGFLYQEKDTSYYYSDKYEVKIDPYMDLRAGLILPVSSFDIKLLYSYEFSKNNGHMNLFSLLFGGRLK